jgi:threonine dehydrogenase-like Zn-dependent dehydrogenase
MTMRSLWCVEPGSVEWREVPAPRLAGDLEAIVAPVAASRCAFDHGLTAGGSPYMAPFAIGHEAVARVVEVGDAVRNVEPGDLVVVPPNIACGECDRCRRGLTAHCRSTAPGAAYGIPSGGAWGGLFDDLVNVPFADAMLATVPAGVDPVEVTAAGDSLALGHDVMSEHVGAGRRSVAVLGSGEHGLYQVAFAMVLGADRVVYVDDDAERREVAAGLGAHAAAGPPDCAVGPFELVVDAAAREDWLRRAVRMLEPEGVIECLGGYFGDIRLPALPLYGGGINIRFGIGSGRPHATATIDAVARGLVRPSDLWAARVPWDDLPTAYAEEPRKIIAVHSGE